MKRRVRVVLTLAVLGVMTTFVLAAMTGSGPTPPRPHRNAAPGPPTPPPRLHFIGTDGHPAVVPGGAVPAPGQGQSPTGTYVTRP